jgi:hypothetical protein
VERWGAKLTLVLVLVVVLVLLELLEWSGVACPCP